MRPHLTSAQGRIIRSLVLFLSKDGKKNVSPALDEVVVESISSREWASLTFTGAQHHVVLRFQAAAMSDGRLDGEAFDLPGAIVAIKAAAWTVTDAGPRLTVDLLAIENKIPSSA